MVRRNNETQAWKGMDVDCRVFCYRKRRVLDLVWRGQIGDLDDKKIQWLRGLLNAKEKENVPSESEN